MWRTLQPVSHWDIVSPGTSLPVCPGKRVIKQLLPLLLRHKSFCSNEFLWRDFCMKLLKAEWEVNQQEGGEEFKCYMIWQMTMAMFHSIGQLRTEKDWDTQKGCQKPALQQKNTKLNWTELNLGGNWPDQKSTTANNEKALRETQTLHAVCLRRSQKLSPHRRPPPPSRGHRTAKI